MELQLEINLKKTANNARNKSKKNRIDDAKLNHGANHGAQHYEHNQTIHYSMHCLECDDDRTLRT